MSYDDDLYEAAEREMDLIREQAEHKSAGLVEENDRLRRDLSVCQDTITRLHVAAGTQSVEDLADVIDRLRRERDEARDLLKCERERKESALSCCKSLALEKIDAELEIDEWKAIVARMPCEKSPGADEMVLVVTGRAEWEPCGKCGPCRARKGE